MVCRLFIIWINGSFCGTIFQWHLDSFHKGELIWDVVSKLAPKFNEIEEFCLGLLLVAVKHININVVTLYHILLPIFHTISPSKRSFLSLPVNAMFAMVQAIHDAV